MNKGKFVAVRLTNKIFVDQVHVQNIGYNRGMWTNLFVGAS